jgi:hypothetical protein
MLKLLFIILFCISCNALEIIGNYETKIDPNFNNNDRQNTDNGQSSNLVCPNDYLYINGNSSLGTSDFCVMQFEAKDFGGIPTSSATQIPWVNIDLPSAKTTCNSLGGGFDLLSNPEWMTIAREIESLASNWTSGVVGSGCIFMGHNGQPTGASGCHYQGATSVLDHGTVGARNILARLILNNGQEIWDFSGNAAEWIDWTVGGALDLGPDSCAGGSSDLNTVSCSALQSSDYLPNDTSLIGTNGVGKLNLFPTANSGKGAAIRGGAINEAASVGIYRLNLSQASTITSQFLSFRCVYRGAP